MSWGSFWLDVNAAPARASIGVTSVLTTVTQIVQSRNNSPPVDYLKVVYPKDGNYLLSTSGYYQS